MSDRGSDFRNLLYGTAVVRPPALVWKHFYYDDAWKLARATAEFYRDHGMAAAKIMPDIPFLFPDLTVTSAKQLSQLRNVGELGRADEYVETVRHTRELLDDDDVLLVTVFAPLALIGMWGGAPLLQDFTAADRVAAHALLYDLAAGVAALIEACAGAGADGVYYSCWGDDVLGSEVYREFGVPYDLAGLRGARSTEFRLLHLHGGRGMDPALYQNYPVHAVGWSQLDTGIPTATAAQFISQLPMGGMCERPEGSAADIRQDAARGLAEVKSSLGANFIATPGCSLPDDVSDDTLGAFLAAVDDVFPSDR